MAVITLLYFAAVCPIVFTNQDSDTDQHIDYNAMDKNNIPASFEFCDAERSDASAIVSSFQKQMRCVHSEPSSLKLTAFNIRTFGTKKMVTPGVPEILVKVSSTYFVRV